jgi:hypothetical protein
MIHVEPMLPEIREKIKRTMKALKGLDYDAEEVSAKEFYDFMTGEIFSEDKTTLRDVLDSDYLMIHELVEISELKKPGRRIDRRVVVDSPRTVIYKAHLFAMEFEMDYALKRGDLAWVKKRIGHHRGVLFDDPNLPEAMRLKAQAIYDKFREYEDPLPNLQSSDKHSVV